MHSRSSESHRRMEFPYESSKSTAGQAGSVQSSADDALVDHFSGPIAEDIVPNSAPTRRCRDPLFAILFLANVGVVAYYAIRYGGKALSNAPRDNDSTLAFVHDESALSVTLCLLAVVLCASILCTAWTRATVQDPGGVLRASYKLWAGVYLLGAVGFAFFGEFASSLACLFGLLGVACIWCAARSRLGFASANLGTACQALAAHPKCGGVVALGMLGNVAWVVVWAFGTAGIAEAHGDGDLNRVHGTVLAWLPVSLLWGCITASNVAHVAVSGAVASWWFHPALDQKPGAVGSALWRGMTSSLGSVALGSLLVAIIEATRALLRNARSSSGPIGRCCGYCLDCALYCLDAYTRFLNRYAFVFVAMYGQTFAEAGSHVDDLFVRRGFWNTVVNDWVLANVLMVSTLGIGLLTALFGYVLGHAALLHPSSHAGPLGLIGLAVGTLAAHVTFGAVSSGVATVYVAFAEDPTALKENHPDAFEGLFEGWNSAYPHVLTHVVLIEEYQRP